MATEMKIEKGNDENNDANAGPPTQTIFTRIRVLPSAAHTGCDNGPLKACKRPSYPSVSSSRKHSLH